MGYSHRVLLMTNEQRLQGDEPFLDFVYCYNVVSPPTSDEKIAQNYLVKLVSM